MNCKIFHFPILIILGAKIQVHYSAVFDSIGRKNEFVTLTSWQNRTKKEFHDIGFSNASFWFVQKSVLLGCCLFPH